ncbi:MAG: D-2-hydroxyacid dehydrogenase [Gemmatimonadota bacterium]|nr:D-2-hydroxyacid dehydrogenase [Gemmatimonadota bacterium]
MKVVLTYDMGESFVEELRTAFPELDFYPVYDEAEQVQEVADAEVVFGLMRRPVFLAAKKLKWFHFVGIGFDPIVRDIPEFRTGDVAMTNARETHVVPMADHVFAAILSYAHRIPELLEDQRNHQWNTKRYERRIIELAGTKMGVLAMGDIGRGVATRAAAFGIEVYAVDILPMEPPPGVCAVWPVERLDEMLGMIDWLVITAPRTKETTGMINRQRLALLKEGAFVVVVSRGGIVDEEALAEGLHSGRIGGAALDATEIEPLPPDSPLWDAPNMLISPHTSAESVQLIERRKAIFVENLHRYLAGEALLNVCDLEKGY